VTDLILSGVSGEGSADLGDWRQVLFVTIHVDALTAKQRVRGTIGPLAVNYAGAVMMGYTDDGAGDTPAGAVATWWTFIQWDYGQVPIPAHVFTSFAFREVFWRLAPGVVATIGVQWNPP